MTRIFIHIVMILLLGVGGGILLRAIRKGPAQVAQELQQTVAPVADKTEDPLPPLADDSIGATNGAEWLQEFTLTERSGNQVSSKDLAGQPYVVSFFFTTCPSICVTQNQNMKQLQQEFAGEGVRLLSITVDPEIDRPEVLAEYAKRFGADPHQWLFLTGDLGYIRRVAAEMYQLPADKKFHSEKFVLMDRDGKRVDFFNWNEPRSFEKLKEAIRERLTSAKES